MNSVKLTFINQSNDQNNSEIVVFQKNEATNFDGQVVAWTVIKNGGKGHHHSFAFPSELEISAIDSYGNYIKTIPTLHGQLFRVHSYGTETKLVDAGQATNNSEVQLLNELESGAIDAQIYKDGKLLAIKTGVAPGQKAIFQFDPTLWVGVVPSVKQGGVMNSAIIQSVDTKFDLQGIASADIVMTGGGPGPNSTPFQFTLENIVYEK